MLKRILLCIWVVGLLLPVFSIEAADEPTDPKLQRLLERYPDADANGDGKLTMEEVEAYKAKMGKGHRRSRSRGASDRTSDARLQHLLKKHPDADVNKDGKLTLDEARAYRDKMGRGGKKERTGGEADLDESILQQMLKKHPDADTNGDGKLTLDEARAYRDKMGRGGKKERTGGEANLDESKLQQMLKKYPDADTNGDGKLTSEEVQAFKDKN